MATGETHFFNKIPPGSADFQGMKTCRGQAVMASDAASNTWEPNPSARTKPPHQGTAPCCSLALGHGSSVLATACGTNASPGFPSGIIR